MNETERTPVAEDATDLAAIMRLEYARGYQDAKRELNYRYYSATSISEAAAIAAVAEALLSPKAVAKGAEQLIWLLKDGVLPYADQPEDEQVDAALAVIEDLNATVLTAIGAQEDCGCTAIDHDGGTVTDVTQCSAPDCPRAAKEGQGDER